VRGQNVLSFAKESADAPFIRNAFKTITSINRASLIVSNLKSSVSATTNGRRRKSTISNASAAKIKTIYLNAQFALKVEYISRMKQPQIVRKKEALGFESNKTKEISPIFTNALQQANAINSIIFNAYLPKNSEASFQTIQEKQ
jgi:hypothetical protein